MGILTGGVISAVWPIINSYFEFKIMPIIPGFILSIVIIYLFSFAEETIHKTDAPAIQTHEEGAWTGIDVSIVGKYASKYGRPPRDPYINTDQGDLPLFVFNLAGVIGGFVIGFNVRRLFYEK